MQHLNGQPKAELYKTQNVQRPLLIKVPRGESPMAHHEERFETNVAERFFCVRKKYLEYLQLRQELNIQYISPLLNHKII